MGMEKSKKRKLFITGVILAIIIAIISLRSCIGTCKKAPPPPKPAPKVESPPPPPPPSPPPPPVEKKKVIKKKPPKPPVEVKKESKWQKGICYVVWSKNHYGTKRSDESLKRLATTNANWVGLHTTWYQEHYNSTEIYPGEKSPTDESLIHAIETIHNLGLKVMLKPHVDLIRSAGGEWRGSIECDTQEDWDAWFDSYTNFMVHYAKLAQEHDVELLCIGTELTTPTTLHPAFWRHKVIKSVREVYDGLLTYAANWNEEYLDIQFWDALDYAGIDPYFPLVDEVKPSFEEIKEGWKHWVSEMEEWQKEINKPVIFTEIGYYSATGAAKIPWEHMPGKNVDIQQQVDCYEALFQTFYDKPWLQGIYWWLWGGSVRIGGLGHRGFSPQNKPTEDVITEWYKKEPEGK